MPQPDLTDRHRDKNGDISHKHRNTLISTLRKIYGQSFAPGCADHAKLSRCLKVLDDRSLSQLARDHERGDLQGKIDGTGR